MFNKDGGILRWKTKQQVRRYQLHKASLLVWLGNSEKTEVRRPPFVRLVEDGVGHPPQEVPKAKLSKPADRQLIDDAILIFDSALDQFDKDDDYQLRQVIDHLAMDVLNRIREYSMASDSARPRSASK